jgi:hypothetical protein
VESGERMKRGGSEAKFRLRGKEKAFVLRKIPWKNDCKRMPLRTLCALKLKEAKEIVSGC